MSILSGVMGASRLSYIGGRLALLAVVALFVYFLFPATAHLHSAAALVTISGNARADGANLAGATVALSGSSSAVTTTDAGGNYSFSVTEGGNYTVSVYKNGFVFTPAAQSFTNVQANQTADFTNGTPLCSPPSTGLVGWYRGEGNLTDSINSNNGANSGAGFGTGKVGQAVTLNGSNNYATIPHSSTNDLVGAGSVSLWVYLNSSDSNHRVLLNKGRSDTNQASFTWEIYNGELRFDLYKGDGSSSYVIALFSASEIVGAWTQLTATWDGTALRLYRNGVLYTTSPYSFVRQSRSDPVGIGRSTNTARLPINGSVDELQFYNRALSASEIASIYNAGSAGVCSVSCVNAPNNSVSWYKGEDNVLDSSGFGNHGGFFNGTFTAGKVGQAMSFNGTNNYVAIPDSSSNSITGQITVAAWIKPTTISGFQVILSKYSDSGKSYFFSFNAGRLYFEVDQSNTIGRSYISTNVVLTAGTFQHVAANFNPSTQLMELYVNGISVPVTLNDANTVTQIQDTASTVRLGDLVNNSGLDANFFNGLIDEAQLFNRVLSASEIQAIVNAGNGVGCQGTTVFTPTSINGKIAFRSDRSGNAEIFNMNADGSNQTNITNNSIYDSEPSYSYDGTKIVFIRNGGSNNDVNVMNSDGSNVVNLTNSAINESNPKFSTDGSKIVFSRYGSGNDEIYIMNADGSNATNLTNNGADDRLPSLSPDGSRIIFVSNRSGNFEIWVMNVNGSNPVKLTNETNTDYYPQWSPDGTKIVFRSFRSGGGDIYMMNADGSNQIAVGATSAFEENPSFSPDGSKILFVSSRDGNYEIYSMNVDGSNQTRLTFSEYYEDFPTWQRTSASVLVTPASNVNLTFANVTQAGNTVATPLTASQIPALPNGYALPTNAPIYDVRTSAAYSGNITVSFNVPNVADSQTCSRLRSVHFENGAWTNGTDNSVPQYNAGTQVCTVSQNVTSLSPFAVIQLPGPTAANVSVGGRVMTANGVGIRSVQVILTDSLGNTRRATTTSFGYYRFDDVPTGAVYTITVVSRKYSFDEPTRVLNVSDALTDVDFSALD